ncbi:MAG: hypothetical protein DMG80_10865 [Acidobacteria bacterium]|nr:MAG: hypothetical protein DMG80_10865 [Acidobacteriota bacterium]
MSFSLESTFVGVILSSAAQSGRIYCKWTCPIANRNPNHRVQFCVTCDL